MHRPTTILHLVLSSLIFVCLLLFVLRGTLRAQQRTDTIPTVTPTHAIDAINPIRLSFDEGKPDDSPGSLVSDPRFTTNDPTLHVSMLDGRAQNAASSTPVVTVWYGNNQHFGHLGNPQRWVNILGNVSDAATVQSLVYRLNGGPVQPLTIGADVRRLSQPGDFNIELDYTTLNNGVNTVLITATNNDNVSTTESVTVNYSAGHQWPQSYDADWSTTTNIQDLAQVVDGEWAIQNSKLRPLIFDYDRLIAIGDLNWRDYEVTAEVTLNALDAVGFGTGGNGPGLGILTRWQGHYQESTEQPRTGWENLGALGWYRWRLEADQSITVRGLLIGYNAVRLAQKPTMSLPFNVPYIFKMQVESVVGQGAFYRFKSWPVAGTEPTTWDMVGQGSANEPGTGSVMLVAHHVDVSFGKVSVRPLDMAPTATATPTTIDIATSTPTVNATPTSTALPTATGTVTVAPSGTATATVTPTPTTIDTATSTPIPSVTSTPTANATPTNTALPTVIGTVTFVPSETATAIVTSTATGTRAPTPTVIPTTTVPSTLTPTGTLTAKPTTTPTITPTATTTAEPIASFELTLMVGGQFGTTGGTVGAVPLGPYAHGQQVTLRAQPAAGYLFAGWLIDNGAAQQNTTTTEIDLTQPLIVITITGNATYTATFAPITNQVYLPLLISGK